MRQRRVSALSPRSASASRRPACAALASATSATSCTRCDVRMSMPSAAQRWRSASSTVWARSVVGKSFPVSSRFNATPSDASQRRVASTSNAASTLRTIGRVPLKSSGRTVSCVTLQRPPPEIRIFAPIRGAPSRTTIRTWSRRCALSAAALRWVSAAKIAAARPAAPPPTIATSQRSSFASAVTAPLNAIRSSGLQPEDVAHRVETRLLLDEPERGAERAAGEALTALRTMRQLETLAGAEKIDRVIADGVAAAQRDDADFRIGPRAGLALAAEARTAGKRCALRIGDDLGEAQRGAARRVALQAVVDLRDLDVERRPERRRCGGDET